MDTNSKTPEQIKSKRLWTRFGIFWMVIAISYILVTLHGNASPKQLSDAQKIYGLSTIWMKSAQFYGYWELLPDLDWDAAYQEFIPKVLDTDNDPDYYAVLEEFFALMQDGHAGVFYPPHITGKQKECLPVEVGYLEQQYYVSAVNDRVCQIPLGSVITSIDTVDAHAYMEQLAGHRVGMHTPYARQSRLAHYFNDICPPDETTLDVITPTGERYRETLRTGSASRASRNRRLNTVSPGGTTVLKRKTLHATDLGEAIYHISIPAFDNDSLGEDFARFIQGYGDRARGFVIDLRGNMGGSTLVGLPVFHHFITPAELAAAMEGERFYQRVDRIGNIMSAVYGMTEDQGYHDGIEMLRYRYYRQEPDQRHLYTNMEERRILEQPVVVLTDWNCVSAGDHVAAFIKFSDRFTLMGTHTAGATGNLASFELPGGGRFGITVYRGLQPDGSDYFNRGVQPDIWAEQTIADLLQQVDTPLEQAIHLINHQINSL